MPKPTYNISLKGYILGTDFDRSKIDKTLAKFVGKELNVLIVSLGAAHISIDAGVMYLFRKWSMAFFE